MNARLVPAAMRMVFPPCNEPFVAISLASDATRVQFVHIARGMQFGTIEGHHDYQIFRYRLVCTPDRFSRKPTLSRLHTVAAALVRTKPAACRAYVQQCKRTVCAHRAAYPYDGAMHLGVSSTHDSLQVP